MADDEKKIIVDEDWKAQAQKEKEKLKEQESSQKPEAADETTAPQQLPEADFTGLVSILASQAFYALGVIRMDEKDEREPDFALAKFNIDLLGLLEDKCEGNLSDEESSMLKATLDQLRMTFVQLTK